PIISPNTKKNMQAFWSCRIPRFFSPRNLRLTEIKHNYGTMHFPVLGMASHNAGGLTNTDG
ncbi:MAG: hypothetical protein MUP44_10975, partial [Anaerolineales bacterium]|nr:hypothetical protein [Anaerolineales bacterium]